MARSAAWRTPASPATSRWQPNSQATGPTRTPSVADVLRTRQAKGQRYLLEGEIARGGMGAVLRAVDCDIRREVAVKYLLDQTDPAKKVALRRGSADHWTA